MQDVLNPDNYHRAKDAAVLAVGGGGVSLTFFDIANYAEAAGAIIGFMIVFYQGCKILRNEFRSWKRKHGANDR